ncbi:MAG: cell division protein FtsL [Syntrophomonas sp.]
MLQAGYDYARVWDPEPVYEADIQVRKVRRTLKKVNCRSSLFLKFALCIFAFAILVVYLCIKTSTLGYQIVALQNDIDKLETSNKRMEYEIAQKSSLQRIEQVATNQLGMFKPGTDVSFTMMVPAKSEQQVKVAKEEGGKTEGLGEKSLHKIYVSLTRMVASTN